MTVLSAAPPEIRRDWPRYLRVATFFRGRVSDVHLVGVDRRPVAVARGKCAAGVIGALAPDRAALSPPCHSLWRRVLIKLGQFLSIRADILPPEITGELAGLQDEVPAETLADIQKVIASEFGKPVAQVFAWLAPEPIAAEHRWHRSTKPALYDPPQEVVVKVQRPRIEMLVETDLAAIHLATRWLRWYRPHRRPGGYGIGVYAEFATTTAPRARFCPRRPQLRTLRSRLCWRPRHLSSE